MVKMQGVEDEGAGSVLKYMNKPDPIATKQIGYYDTPPCRLALPDRVFTRPSHCSKRVPRFKQKRPACGGF